MKHNLKMETVNTCPVCEGTNFFFFLECTDYTVSKALFTINNCNKCGFKFTSPRPTEIESGKYYESDEYVSHSNTSKGLINGLYQMVRKHTLKKKLALVNACLSPSQFKEERAILDFGCGTGQFLNIC